MYRKRKLAAIIPARNEAESLPFVLRDIPHFVDRIIVCDNGSVDTTFALAESKQYHPNSEAVSEPKPGYGNACLAGMGVLRDEDIVIFLDGDYSDYPERIGDLIDPIIDGEADAVLANRNTPECEPGALSATQRFGNALAVLLIRILYGHSYRDLGPFRAIRHDSLQSLHMRDPNYGWTIELQTKAILRGLRVLEIDLPYRNRIRGQSKVSGTIRGVLGAGWKIISRIFYYRFFER